MLNKKQERRKKKKEYGTNNRVREEMMRKTKISMQKIGERGFE